MRPGAKKSVTWKYFKKSDDNKFVTCVLCKKQYKFFGNTTNLNNHIRRIHPVEYRTLTNEDSPEADDPIQSSTSEDTFKRSQPSAQTGKQQQQQQQHDTGEPALKRQRQLKLFGLQTKTTLSDTEKDELDSLLVEMIVTDFQPLNFVENSGFLR